MTENRKHSFGPRMARRTFVASAAAEAGAGGVAGVLPENLARAAAAVPSLSRDWRDQHASWNQGAMESATRRTRRRPATRKWASRRTAPTACCPTCRPASTQFDASTTAANLAAQQTAALQPLPPRPGATQQFS